MAESILSTEQQGRSIWHLGGLSAKELAKQVREEIDHDNVVGLASGIAYNFLLSLFPLLLFLVSLFGLFASRGTQLKSNLFFYFSQILPPAAYELVSKTIAEVTRNASGGKITLGSCPGTLVRFWRDVHIDVDTKQRLSRARLAFLA
jgi:uncharacterized BrkB/YihY/UPF0761 family membrane protein